MPGNDRDCNSSGEVGQKRKCFDEGRNFLAGERERNFYGRHIIKLGTGPISESGARWKMRSSQRNDFCGLLET